MSRGLFPLEIDREVRLNLLEPRHALDLFKLVDLNRTHLREWLPFIDDYESVTAATQFIMRNEEESRGEKGLVMGIWVGEILAGVVTFDHIDWRNRAALIGFWLGMSFQGRGIMTRTCSALIDLAFNELGSIGSRFLALSKTGDVVSCLRGLGLGRKESLGRESGYTITLSIPSAIVCLLRNGKTGPCDA